MVAKEEEEEGGTHKPRIGLWKGIDGHISTTTAAVDHDADVAAARLHLRGGRERNPRRGQTYGPGGGPHG